MNAADGDVINDASSDVSLESRHDLDSDDVSYLPEVIVEGQQMNRVRVRFPRQDSNQSTTSTSSRASSRYRRDEKRRHVTGDDIVLPFPLEVSQKDAELTVDANRSSSGADGSSLNDCCRLEQLSRAKELITRGVAGLEELVRQQQASIEELRHERVEVVKAWSARYDSLETENASLRQQLDRVLAENNQLQERTVNSWKHKIALEEELVKLRATKSSRKALVQGHVLDVKDITGDLRVTGSSVAGHDLESEGRNKLVGHRTNKSPPGLMRTNLPAVSAHESYLGVTSEKVTSLDQALRLIREKCSASHATMLAATFPPRPRDPLVIGSGQNVNEVGEGSISQTCISVPSVPAKTTLQLPVIRHRASSLT